MAVLIKGRADSNAEMTRLMEAHPNPYCSPGSWDCASTPPL
jgi:hypothetical protein